MLFMTDDVVNDDDDDDDDRFFLRGLHESVGAETYFPFDLS